MWYINFKLICYMLGAARHILMCWLVRRELTWNHDRNLWIDLKVQKVTHGVKRKTATVFSLSFLGIRRSNCISLFNFLLWLADCLMQFLFFCIPKIKVTWQHIYFWYVDTLSHKRDFHWLLKIDMSTHFLWFLWFFMISCCIGMPNPNTLVNMGKL